MKKKTNYKMPGFEDMDNCWMNPDMPDCKGTKKPLNTHIAKSQETNSVRMSSANIPAPRSKPMRDPSPLMAGFGSTGSSSGKISTLMPGMDMSFGMGKISKNPSKASGAAIDPGASIQGMKDSVKGVQIMYNQLRGRKTAGKPAPLTEEEKKLASMSPAERALYLKKQQYQQTKADVKATRKLDKYEAKARKWEAIRAYQERERTGHIPRKKGFIEKLKGKPKWETVGLNKKQCSTWDKIKRKC